MFGGERRKGITLNPPPPPPPHHPATPAAARRALRLERASVANRRTEQAVEAVVAELLEEPLDVGARQALLYVCMC